MRRIGLVLGVSSALFAASHAGAQTAIGAESDTLYSVNLATGLVTTLGLTGFDDVEGLSFQPGTGVLFGVDDETDALVTCSPVTGVCTLVGGLGVDVSDPGLAFTCAGTLYLSSENEDTDQNNLYTVNPATGAATLVGFLGGGFDGMSLAYSPIASGCASGMWVLDGNDDPPTLGCVSLTTGAVTVIGSVGIALGGQPAIEFDAFGTLWVVEEETDGIIATVNSVTGAATARPYTLSGPGVEALAISGVCAVGDPVPAADSYRLVLLVVLIAAAGWAVLRRITS